jgi:Zn-dependent M32 family carboxypeptidase
MATNIQSAYRKLIEKNKNLIVLSTAQAIISWIWDMMPTKAINMRSEQLSLLSQIQHK